MTKLVGLYGGTFDPIHWGHLNLALELMEKKQLDEVWFILAKINPHKLENKPLVSEEHRFEMLKLALQGIPCFHPTDLEIKRDGPSFTIDTIKHLLDKERKNCSFALLLGEDSAHDFHQWRHADEIVHLVPVFVGSRHSAPSQRDLKGDPALQKALLAGWTRTRIMEISATDIRNRIKNGLYCGHLIPKECIDYIYNNHLYSM